LELIVNPDRQIRVELHGGNDSLLEILTADYADIADGERGINAPHASFIRVIPVIRG
jgi:hypothetical protein